MSDFEDQQARLHDRYIRSRAQLERSRAIEAGQAGALMFAAVAYDDALKGNSLFAALSHGAKLFCIAAVFVIPNLLVWHALL